MALQKDGAFVAVHLADAPEHDVKENVVPAMDEFPCDSLTTMMILCSPQYITDNIGKVSALESRGTVVVGSTMPRYLIGTNE